MIIAQITDTHILPKDQSWLQMPETDVTNRLKRVVERLNKLHPKPDVLLLTGDATDAGDKESYQHLKEILRPLTMPVFIIPGNHDNREEMREAFSDKSYMPQKGFIQYAIDDYPVRLIGLDTLVPNEVYGLLCKERLRWLEETLKENPSKPTLLFMHHFPMKVGQKCVDTLICQMEGDFEKLIGSSPQILGIVAGHYHKLTVTLIGGKVCFVAPSIAASHHFASDEDMQPISIDLVSPSLALHRWMGDFKMVSESLQIVTMENQLPFHIEREEKIAVEPYDRAIKCGVKA